MSPRPSLPDVVERFAAYHRSHPEWGVLHVVLSGGNIRDVFVEGLATAARERGDEEGAALAEILAQLSPTQRGKLPRAVDRFNWKPKPPRPTMEEIARETATRYPNIMRHLAEAERNDAVMKHYEVWMEGYAASGGRSGARRIGSIEAETFAEACDKLCSGKEAYGRDPQLNIWACRLFDNEADARRRFG